MFAIPSFVAIRITQCIAQRLWHPVATAIAQKKQAGRAGLLVMLFTWRINRRRGYCLLRVSLAATRAVTARSGAGRA